MPAVDSIPLVPMQLGGVHPQHASAEAVTYRCAKDGLVNIATGAAGLQLIDTSGLLRSSASLLNANKAVVATLTKDLFSYRSTYRVFAGTTKTQILKLVVRNSWFKSVYTCDVIGNENEKYRLVCRGDWDTQLLITCDDTAVAKIRPPAAGVDGSYLDVAPGVEASVLLLVQFAAVDCESSCIASTDAVASTTT